MNRASIFCSVESTRCSRDAQRLVIASFKRDSICAISSRTRYIAASIATVCVKRSRWPIMGGRSSRMLPRLILDISSVERGKRRGEEEEQRKQPKWRRRIFFLSCIILIHLQYSLFIRYMLLQGPSNSPHRPNDPGIWPSVPWITLPAITMRFCLLH